MKKSILLLVCFFCTHCSLAQVMNVQTNSGVIHFNLSDIINITFADENLAETVTDIDGNNYRTVKIGNQVWMAENLKVTHYRNGDLIPNVMEDSEWMNLSTGAYSNYDNNPERAATYGRLYNWHAVNDNRGLAPSGWHVPSDAEWQTLVNFLGGESVAGGKMKSPGTIDEGTGLWTSPNNAASNQSGFSAVPGGFRYYFGPFSLIGSYANIWSSSENDASHAWHRGLYNNQESCSNGINYKCFGFSVRCIKDK